MSLSGLAPFDRRGHQRRLLVDALRRARMASRAELSAAAGLSPQLVTLLVEELIGEGLIREVGRRPAARGQPPIDLALDPEGGFALGLQIERDGVTGIAVDLETRVRAQKNVPCRTDDPALALPAVMTLVKRLIAAARIDRGRLWGVGLVLPGPFGAAADPDDPLSMPGWARQEFVAGYSAALGAPVVVGNDATAAAIGEHLNGVARDLQNFVYLYLGEGVGSGLFSEGRPLTGAKGNAGEIGRMLVVDSDGGGLVPLESVASLSALRSMLVAAGCAGAGDAGPEALPGLAPPVTVRWLMRAAPPLRMAIANIENLLDPDAIVLGGPLPAPLLKRLAGYLEPLPASVGQRADRAWSRLMIGSSGRASPALGGATLPLFMALTPQPSAARPSRQKPARAFDSRGGAEMRP